MSISYTAYLADLDSYQSEHSLETMARCPDLFASATSREEVAGVTVASATYHYETPSASAGETPYVLVPTSLPSNYNLTGKVTVRTQSQVLHYYYSNSAPSSEDSSSHKPLYVSIVIVILIAAAVGGFLCYRTVKKKRLAREQLERERQEEYGRNVEMSDHPGIKPEPQVDHRIDLLTGEPSRVERR